MRTSAQVILVLLTLCLVNFGSTTNAPTSLPTNQPSSEPSSQPSGFPSGQPTTQPSSRPTAGSSTGVWTVPVTQLADDATFDPSVDKNPCCADHWAFTSTTCTLRAAFAFCFTEVPWDSGPDTLLNVTSCKITFAAANQVVSLSTSAITVPDTFTVRKNVTVDVMGDATTVTQSTHGQRAFSIVDSVYATYPDSTESKNYGIHVRFTDITFSDIGDRSSASTAVSNAGTDGVGVYASRLRSLVFSDCVFYRNSGRLGSGVYAENATYLWLDSCAFVDNDAVSGGGIFLRHVGNVDVTNCNFTDNAAVMVGGGLATEECNRTAVSDSVFWGNIAGTHGGGMSVHRSLLATDVTANTFTLNTAKYGSAAFFRKANTWSMDDNAFISNSCLRMGGTLFWIRGATATADSMEAPLSYTGNSFSGNTYGTGTADSMGVSTEPFNVTVSPTNLRQEDYLDDAPFTATAVITDYYGNEIPDVDAAMSLVVQNDLGHADGCSYNDERVNIGFTGSTTGVSSEGSYTYDGFGALCIPGGYLTASAEASFSVGPTNFPLYYEVNSADQQVYDSSTRAVYGTTYITFRRCEAGEYYNFQDSASRKKCLACENGFTVANTSTNDIIECTACPDDAISCYSDNIVLRVGTWRYSYYTSTIFDCPMFDSCMGGELYGEDSCSEGSSGPLCGVCSSGYARSSDGDYCYACSSWRANPGPAFIVPMTLFSTLVVGYLVYQTYRIRKHHRLINIVYPSLPSGAGNQHHPSKMTLEDPTAHATLAGTLAAGGHVDTHDHLIHEERATLRQELSATYHAAREALYEVHDKLHLVQSGLYEQMMKTSGKVKILFSTYQILVLLPTNFRLVQPFIGNNFRQFCNSFMFMHFDVMRALPLSCYRDWTYLDSMKAITTIPLVISSVLIVGYLTYMRYYAYAYKPSSLLPVSGLEAYFRRNDPRLHALSEAQEAFERELLVMRQSMLSRFLFVAVICSYMSVPHVLLSVIKVFDCVDIDPLAEVEAYSGVSSTAESTTFLRADFSINCSSVEYESSKAYVVFMCIIYPLLFCVIYFVLYRKAQHISQMSHFHHHNDDSNNSNNSNALLNVSAAIRFLFLESYKPHLLVWELVDLAKRLLLCCALYSMQPGTSLQTMAALLICLFFYKLQCRYRPYLKKNDNALAELGYIQLSGTIFLLFLYRNQTVGDYRNATAATIYTTFDVVLTGGNCVLMACILYLTTIGTIKHFQVEPLILKALRRAKRALYQAAGLQVPENERPLNGDDEGDEENNGLGDSRNRKSDSRRGRGKGRREDGIRCNDHDHDHDRDDNKADDNHLKPEPDAGTGTGTGAGAGDSIDAMSRRIMARSYINDIVQKVRRFREFNKDQGQLRHTKLKNRRHCEYQNMRRDFQQLLDRLNTPGNDLVQVLMVSDESTLDELNEHKKLLEDALTDAENHLHDVQQRKKGVIIDSGLPYDRLQNLGDATRFTRDDYRFFAEPYWLPTDAAIDDNRLDRTWLRPPEHLDPAESRGLINEHGFVDVTESVLANRNSENQSQYQVSDSDDDDEDGDDDDESNPSQRGGDGNGGGGDGWDSDDDFEEQFLNGNNTNNNSELVGNFPATPATPAAYAQNDDSNNMFEEVEYTSDTGSEASDGSSSIENIPDIGSDMGMGGARAFQMSDSDSEEEEEKAETRGQMRLHSLQQARTAGAFAVSSSEFSSSGEEDGEEVEERTNDYNDLDGRAAATAAAATDATAAFDLSGSDSDSDSEVGAVRPAEPVGTDGAAFDMSDSSDDD